MKNNSAALLLAAALTAGAFVSCTKEAMKAPETENPAVTFHAVYADGASTKTVLQDNLSVLWDESEDINLFYGPAFKTKFSSTGDGPSATAEFNGSLNGIDYSDGDGFLAVYPYSEANESDGESVTLTLPDAQTAIAGTFADGTGILIAKAGADDRSLSFYHLCGGVRFTLTESDVQSVTFRGRNGEPLAGTVKAAFGEDGRPAVTEVADGKTELTLAAPEGGTLEAGPWYYLLALPAELTQGYTLTLHKTDGTEIVKESEKSVTIKRAIWGSVANVGAPPVSEEIPDNEIWYTSSDGETVTPNDVSAFGANIVSHTYSNGKGIIKFDAPVTRIGDQAFSECASLTSITLPESITVIGVRAFYWCISLTSITLPESVTTIGTEAFINCTKLEAFYGKFASEDHRCLIVDTELIAFAPAGLTVYVIPAHVTIIGVQVFFNCVNLTEITIPESVTVIKEQAFYSCTNLVTITIPDSVTFIGIRAFACCTNLRAFYGLLASADHRCLIIAGELIAFAPAGLTVYEIPVSVTVIGEWAFSECSILTSIVIPSSVTVIKAYAFYLCIELTIVDLSVSVTVIGDYAFYRCTNLTEITIPASVTTIGDYAFYWCVNLERVTLPESVTIIGTYAFYYCIKLTVIIIPVSVIRIGAYAFSSCTNLTHVYVYCATPPESGDNIFEGCPLTVIYIPAFSLDAYQAVTFWSVYIRIFIAILGTEQESTIEDIEFEPWS